MCFVKKNYHFNKIDSTSAYILQRSSLLKNFTTVSADIQTDGRGRLGRVWESESGNLFLSVYINDKDLCNKFNYLSVGVALSVINALRKIGLKNLSLKWPNDVYASGKKICGILLESVSNENVITDLVIGIGLNVNQEKFSGDYFVKPTSVFIESGKKEDVNKIKRAVVKEIKKTAKQIKKENYSFIEYANLFSYLNGKKAFAEINGEKKEITVNKINKDASLSVFDGTEIKDISFGEITFHI